VGVQPAVSRKQTNMVPCGCMQRKWRSGLSLPRPLQLPRMISGGGSVTAGAAAAASWAVTRVLVPRKMNVTERFWAETGVLIICFFFTALMFVTVRLQRMMLSVG
jgi:hypothetical protein